MDQPPPRASPRTRRETIRRTSPPHVAKAVTQTRDDTGKTQTTRSESQDKKGNDPPDQPPQVVNAVRQTGDETDKTPTTRSKSQDKKGNDPPDQQHLTFAGKQPEESKEIEGNGSYGKGTEKINEEGKNKEKEETLRQR